MLPDWRRVVPPRGAAIMPQKRLNVGNPIRLILKLRTRGPAATCPSVCEFDAFSLDPQERTLRRDGELVRINLVTPSAEVRLATPRPREHPAKPKIGLGATRADEMWHIDTTVIRLLDGLPAYLHDAIDNLSDPGVAGRRHLRTGQQRGRAPRSQLTS